MCQRKRARDYAIGYYDRNRTRIALRRHDIAARAVIMVNQARSRAKRTNLPFDLTVDWVLEQLRGGRCAVTGIPFELEIGGRSQWGSSLDQIVSGLGYTKSNTQVVCWIYNAAKGTGTHDDVLKLAKALNERSVMIES